jgi:hypothetical protein
MAMGGLDGNNRDRYRSRGARCPKIDALEAHRRDVVQDLGGSLSVLKLTLVAKISGYGIFVFYPDS